MRKRRKKTCYLRISSYVFGALFLLLIQATFHAKLEIPAITPSDILTESRQRMTYQVDPLVQKSYDAIDQESNETICARYGFTYKPRKSLRRIFYGSLIADDSLTVVHAHATEAYNIYHTVALVESNLTQSATARRLLYTTGSARKKFVQSGIFGPQTRVHVDFYFNSDTNVEALVRENMQRQLIISRWKQNGMRKDDIGMIGDIDETLSREALRAVQLCDIPSFQVGQDCRMPKVFAYALVFEGSPECLFKRRPCFHPDMIRGECVEGIGDSTGRPIAKREYQGKYGLRLSGYGGGGRDDYTDAIKRNGSYPLWNADDFRRQDGTDSFNSIINWKGPREKGRAYSAAFHFHNFFDDMETLRNKYATYGHPLNDAKSIPLSMIQEDINLMVQCVHDLPYNDSVKNGRYLDGFESIKGPKPIFFLVNESYRHERHDLVRRQVLEDEKEHGSAILD